AVLDALAEAGPGGAEWLSLGWDAWDNAAEAKSPGMPSPITPEEGRDAFLRALGVEAGPRLVVAVDDLAARLRTWVRHEDASPGTDDQDAEVERHPRPNLPNAFVAPRTDVERELA